MSKRVVIVANAPGGNGECVRARVASADLIIAADGAANTLPPGITPHIVCGDFDSIREDARRRDFPQAQFIRSECQETNDLEKCIRLAVSLGASSVAISCALGGRIDHFFTTFSILERYHREIPIVLHDGERTCRVVSGGPGEETTYELAAVVGDTISVVPRGDGAVVSLVNAEWPLTRERLCAGSRGVSNRATTSSVRLTVHEGVVFLFHAPYEA